MPPLVPKNLTAKEQFVYRARGNPPSTTPDAAISNCFPGLEFDIRNVWKLIFEGVELHEAGFGADGHLVLAVQPGSAAATAGVGLFDRLLEVDGRPVDTQHVLPAGPTADRVALEFSNALSHVVGRGGQTVQAVFESQAAGRVTVPLTIRHMFDGVALAEAVAEPGALTQSLCSPWQADYRECGCYYWAASRPDFVNVEAVTGGSSGHDWMQRDRSPGAPYRPDRGGFSANHILYDDLYAEWERHLRFVIGGQDEP